MLRGAQKRGAEALHQQLSPFRRPVLCVRVLANRVELLAPILTVDVKPNDVKSNVLQLSELVCGPQWVLPGERVLAAIGEQQNGHRLVAFPLSEVGPGL